MLGTTAQLAAVIGVAAGCDVAREDTGLIAAIFMGLALANRRGFDIPARRPFFEILVRLIIGVPPPRHSWRAWLRSGDSVLSLGPVPGT